MARERDLSPAPLGAPVLNYLPSVLLTPREAGKPEVRSVPCVDSRYASRRPSRWLPHSEQARNNPTPRFI